MMNLYIYWYFANTFLFNHLFGWLVRKNKGVAIYLLISSSPQIAFYALPFLVLETYFNMMTMCNKYIYWILMFGVPVLHLSIFYPGSKRYAKWENEYRRTCKDWKNLFAILFSLCCIVVTGILFYITKAAISGANVMLLSSPMTIKLELYSIFITLS